MHLTRCKRLKDSDVTWLYGPLHTAAEPVPPARVASTEDRLDLVKAFGKKPILKHRSISELLSIPRGSSPSLEASQLDAIPEGHESPRPVLYQTKSESYITRTGVRRVSPPLPDLAHAPDLMIGEESAESPKPGSDTDSMASNNTKRHITFNTFVEQCIAIDKPVHATHDNRPPWRLGFSGSPYSGDDECEDDAIYEDDEDTVLTMRSTSSSGQSSPASSRRPSSSANSRSNSYSSDHVTIQAIAPTMLKTQYDSAPGDLPAVVFVPPLGSPYAEDPTIAPTRYAHQPSPGFGSSQATLHIGGHSGRNPAATRSQWEDDDGHRGVGFDFFGGPDVGMEDEYESTKSSPRLVSTSRVSPAPPHASASGSVSPTTTTHLDLPKSPPTSPAKGNKLPGKSILKPSFPDAAIAEALRESVDELDHYFSQGSNPVAPPTSCGAPASQMHEPASEGSALPTSLDSSAARISPSMSSEHLNTSVGAPARGRSAVRIPGTAIGIADRERSASSKGSSPIGSVSPNSRSIPTGSSSRTTVVRVGGSRMGRVHPGASSSPQNTRSPSRGAVSSTSSGRSPSPPQYNGSLGDGVIRNEGAGSNVSVQREGPFQPSKSTPVRSPTPTKRLSMDIVPVLSTESQLAQAQQPPGSTSRRRTSDSPAGDLSPEPAARHVDGENAYARLSRSEEVRHGCVSTPLI